MTWSLFEITPERAAETRKRPGFLTLEEREQQERANREPLPYEPTPEALKRERMEALERRLVMAGKDPGWA